REGYVANTVDHPGAVAVLDDDTTDDGAAFLVMELLAGKTVEALGNVLHARVVLAVAHQVADVLQAAHDKGIVHRDIKPANLFALADGTVKVLDFGIARVREATLGGASATSTGMMMGTPAFMPPEQAMAKQSEIDARTDVWALGATMFTMLSGAYVHVGDNATQMVIHAATQKARSVASVSPELDPRVARVVDRALAFDKSERWATAAELRDAIDDVHRATFGEPVARACIAELVPRTAPATAPAPASAALESGALPIPLGTVRMASAGSSARTPAPAVAAPAVGTLSQPVSNTVAPAAPSRRPYAFVAVGAAAIAVLVAATMVIHNASSSATPASTAATTTGIVVPATQATQTSGELASSYAIATPSPSQTHESIVATPPVVASTSAPRPKSSAHVAASAASIKPPATSCDPPYVIDSSGKHYKPECLK
ncbi:MAG TPA: serine/threonine-protein kinase, partial [Polyangiaceae bacterium]